MNFIYKQLTTNKSISLICLSYVIFGITLFDDPSSYFYYPDSGSYLRGNVARSSLYVWLIELIGEYSLPKIQVIIFGFLLLLLGVIISKFNKTIATFTVILVAVHLHLLDFHFHIMTESIHSSLNIAFLCFFTAYILYRNVAWLVAMSVCAGLAISVKISAIPLAPILFITPLLIKSHHRKKHIIASLIPALLIFIAERGYKYQTHSIEGLAYGNHIGAHLYAKAALSGHNTPDVNINDMSHMDKTLFLLIKNDLKEARQIIRNLDYFSSRVLETSYEITLNLRSKVDDRIQDLWKTYPETRDQSVNERKIKIALMYILKNFDSYIMLSLNNYISTLSYVFPPDYFIKQANRTLPALWPVPFIGSGGEELSVRYVDFSWQRASYIYSHAIGKTWEPIPSNGLASSVIWITMIFVGIVTGAFAYLGLITALIKRDSLGPAALLAVIPALAAHIHILITGAIAVSGGRYLIPQWPMLATSLAASLFIIGRWIHCRFYAKQIHSSQSVKT